MCCNLGRRAVKHYLLPEQCLGRTAPLNCAISGPRLSNSPLNRPHYPYVCLAPHPQHTPIPHFSAPPEAHICINSKHVYPESAESLWQASVQREECWSLLKNEPNNPIVGLLALNVITHTNQQYIVRKITYVSVLGGHFWINYLWCEDALEYFQVLNTIKSQLQYIKKMQLQKAIKSITIIMASIIPVIIRVSSYQIKGKSQQHTAWTFLIGAIFELANSTELWL